MNWLDILLAVLFVFRTFFGWKQGIVKGALFLASSILGITLAGIFYQPFAAILGFIPIEYAANLVAFILILICVEIATAFPIRLLNPILSAAIPRRINLIGGAVFGFLMGAVEFTALLAIWVTFFPSALVIESFLAGILLDKSHLILGLLRLPQ